MITGFFVLALFLNLSEDDQASQNQIWNPNMLLP